MKKTIYFFVVFLIFVSCGFQNEQKENFHDLYIYKVQLIINGDCESILINDEIYTGLPEIYSDIKLIGLIDEQHCTLNTPIRYEIKKLTDENESIITAEIYLNDEILMSKTISESDEKIEFVIEEI